MDGKWKAMLNAFKTVSGFAVGERNIKTAPSNGGIVKEED